ncbi:sigma-54-dependent Fis family transcriptional regulator [Metabacillus sediminilitoris]|uniref:PAS domain S-box protein n=1 Tax=Metabacillus sediminilitoris TaxID=2567941 RepID=A0A4S4BLM7_9BACI|nr:sigma-54-dependent Fis family transcriptional regulator [Metabacillus sediminilitoris]QGQ45611.1 AAA domain-containing protein [Metabacillus sediminilitoris]THF75678.1 PAS domain S-box protein [Metabacillus sediminilitoris]
MNFKMIMTSGNPELTAKIEKIAKELNFSVTVVEGILNEAAQEVKRLVSQGGFEVVISRAGTAKGIAKLVPLPVIHSASSNFDILDSFKRAKELGDKICFITYPEEGFAFNFDQVIETVGFDVTILPYHTWDELVKQIKKAKEMGMEVVVGGGIRAHEIVQNYGMKSMNIITSERTIKRTLILASQVAQDRILIKKETERLKAVINVTEEGILFLSKDGHIETFNPAAERIFGIKESFVTGKRIEEIRNPLLLNLLQEKNIYTDNGSFRLQNLIVNYEPLIVGIERIGTVIICREISKIQKLESEIRRELHSKGLIARFTLEDIRHKSEQMELEIKLAKEYAATDSTVLIIGESGTGKELMAQGIHNASNRKDGPFVAVNCAALPENLIESELFGYAAGAFTGANKGGKQGFFELAHGGTIFLDEIGEIPDFIQTRLLRVLQEKEVMRVGGDRVIPVNIRVVAATNRKLWDMVREGKFRSDLYFRLNVLHMGLPPLRHRMEDIPILVDFFLQKMGSRLCFEDFSDNLKNFFLTYSWPGNIRQLENIIERIQLGVQKFKGEDAFINDILSETEEEDRQLNQNEVIMVQFGTMDEIEKQVINKMMQLNDHNKTVVAEKLGISRTTLWKKLSETS